MLRWEYDRVVCVQALSRYLICPYPELFHDVWVLHDHAATSPETREVLRRFWDRGVRLVAVHRTSGMMGVRGGASGGVAGGARVAGEWGDDFCVGGGAGGADR